MKDLNASNALIATMYATLPGLANLFFAPVISTWSDRHRGRFGRRKPFLLVATPLVALALLLIGFCPEIGNWLYAKVFVGNSSISASAVMLGLLCLFVFCFHVFNMVLCYLYMFLYREVIPDEVIGRFLSVFRLVGLVASFVFLYYIMGFLATHRALVFSGAALLCFVSFGVMCLMVKEGEHEPIKEEPEGLLKKIKDYLKVFIRIPIYRNYYLMIILMTAAGAGVSAFGMIFARDQIGLSLDAIGKIQGWGYAAMAVVAIPAGMLCDLWNPLKATIVGFLATAVSILVLSLGIHDARTYMIFFVATSTINLVMSIGLTSVGMLIFDKEKFGQLYGNGILVQMISGMVFGYVAGWLLDIVKNYYVIFIWQGVFLLIATIPCVLMYREWLTLGGAHGAYCPPKADFHEEPCIAVESSPGGQARSLELD